MCGIIGIVTSQDKPLGEMIKESLLRLTYRGYDSCGMAIQTGNRLDVVKIAGRAEQLVLTKDIMSRAGIGHTRWATHGEPSEVNAHPHLDCSDNIAVVHNGIIDNYLELKGALESKGHVFKSATDTEVIPHLIEDKLKENGTSETSTHFLFAFRDAIRELKGTYAIAALWNKDGKIYAARKTSPLLIGEGKGENFVASDIYAFLEYTNTFIPLDDYQIAVVSKDDFKLWDFELKQMTPEKYKYPYGIEEISKGKYKHFMIKEIKEQDLVLQSVLQEQDEIASAAVKIAEKIKGAYRRIQKVYFVGCGSSYHACLAGEYIFERLLKIPSEAVLSSEFKIAIKNINDENSLIVAISQSGETLDTYAVLEEISKLEKKPLTLAIINTPYSSEERLVKTKLSSDGIIIHLHAKPEICVVATKTYTAQLFVLAILALHIGTKTLPEEEQTECKELLEQAKLIPEKARKTIGISESMVNTLVMKYFRYSRSQTETMGYRENFFIIGRGINLATSYEAALKLREVCYISALGIAGGELKHGSLAAVDNHTPVIILFPPSSDTEIWKSLENNFMEIQARRAPIISICGEGDIEGQIQELSEYVIKLPDTSWIFLSILQIIFIQLFAYSMAVTKDIDPDYPQHIAKTVTVE